MDENRHTYSRDSSYLEIILSRVRVCKTYKPKFGQGRSSGVDSPRVSRLIPGRSIL